MDRLLNIEDSIEDDLDDLRKDFKNVVQNDIVKKLDIMEKKNEELTRNLESCQATNGLILKRLDEVISLIAERQQKTNT